MSENPYIRKEGERFIITEEGYKKLSEVVTDPVGQVYAFNGKLSPVIVAAAMARLSRRRGDMREAILAEFMGTEESQRADKLIERVVSGFGDDSVQQLLGLQYVVEGASNLLTKFIELGRFASYLEQSTRYIFFDEKDENGNYSYYIPKFSDYPKISEADASALRNMYIKTNNQIMDNYSHMVRSITSYLRSKREEPADKNERIAWLNSTRAAACDAVRPVLPVSIKSTVGIFASSQALERMYMNLRSEPLEEARNVADKILAEARKVIPAFLERADMPDRGGMISAHRATVRGNVRDMARKWLHYGPPIRRPGAEVKLISYWPKNELDLVSEILFQQAESLSLSEIQKQVKEFSTVKKAKILRAYMGERFNRRHRPGRAFEKAHFEWEIVGDYGTFRDLQRHRVVDSFEWQKLSPSLGYEVPDLVKEAGFEHQFRECFDLSAELYDAMAMVDEFEAQYAVLLGHKMRYRFIINLRQAFHMFELRTGPEGHPGYRRICNDAYELLKDVYPITGEGMRFINKKDDLELARLESERRTQKKLDKLDSKEKK